MSEKSAKAVQEVKGAMSDDGAEIIISSSQDEAEIIISSPETQQPFADQDHSTMVVEPAHFTSDVEHLEMQPVFFQNNLPEHGILEPVFDNTSPRSEVDIYNDIASPEQNLPQPNITKVLREPLSTEHTALLPDHTVQDAVELDENNSQDVVLENHPEDDRSDDAEFLNNPEDIASVAILAAPEDSFEDTIPDDVAPEAQEISIENVHLDDVNPYATIPNNDMEHFLAEEVLPTTLDAFNLLVGEVYTWEAYVFRITEQLPRGWYTALLNPGTNPQTILVHTHPHATWTALLGHKITPKPLYHGEQGIIYPKISGDIILFPTNRETALSVIEPLAGYVLALYKQGYSLIDLDPLGILRTPEGLKLQFPPRLARLNEPLSPVYREGYTAPEVAYATPASGKEGVYYLGALFYHLLTGNVIPAEGVSLALLQNVHVSGAPQVLKLWLDAPEYRIAPEDIKKSLNILKPKISVKWHIGAACDVGLNPERPTNEDSYAYREGQTYSHHQKVAVVVACVSDGMGGMAAGEIASQAAVESWLQHATFDTIEQAMWKANNAVQVALDGSDGGCTFSGVVCSDDKVRLGHVGDTRAYWFNGTALLQISKDHSLVAALVASGILTPQEAETSPERNKVLRSLGSLKQYQHDYMFEYELKAAIGNKILLVSDGVWGEVPLTTLQDLIHQPAQQAANAMVQAALDAGASDNATALVLERIR